VPTSISQPAPKLTTEQLAQATVSAEAEGDQQQDKRLHGKKRQTEASESVNKRIGTFIFLTTRDNAPQNHRTSCNAEAFIAERRQPKPAPLWLDAETN
jgi:hypothetical protein